MLTTALNTLYVKVQSPPQAFAFLWCLAFGQCVHSVSKASATKRVSSAVTAWWHGQVLFTQPRDVQQLLQQVWRTRRTFMASLRRGDSGHVSVGCRSYSSILPLPPVYDLSSLMDKINVMPWRTFALAFGGINIQKSRQDRVTTAKYDNRLVFADLAELRRYSSILRIVSHQ
jgi:hypothetical protein